MPRFNVTLNGSAWVALKAQVEAEDEAEAKQKALEQGQWIITGDVEETSAAVSAGDDSKD